MACALLLLASPTPATASPPPDVARVTRYLVSIDPPADEGATFSEDGEHVTVPWGLWTKLRTALEKEPHYAAELEAKDRELAAKQREIESWAKTAAGAERRSDSWQAAAEKAYAALEPPSRFGDPVVWLLGAAVLVLGVSLAVVATKKDDPGVVVVGAGAAP